MIKEMLESAATRYNLDSNYIIAIAINESSCNQLAVRYEPLYRWIYKPEFFCALNNTTWETEVHLQKMSFGVMQIMGAVARELGHNGNMLELAHNPAVAIEYSIRHFLSFYERYKNYEDAIASYNAGSPKKDKEGKYINQKYVDKVLFTYECLRKA